MSKLCVRFVFLPIATNYSIQYLANLIVTTETLAI
jgi:hypothetical protein